MKPLDFNQYDEVCLFWVLSITPSEGLQILIYSWHSRPLSSKGFLACHTYCDTGHVYIWPVAELYDKA